MNDEKIGKVQVMIVTWLIKRKVYPRASFTDQSSQMLAARDVHGLMAHHCPLSPSQATTPPSIYAASGEIFGISDPAELVMALAP
ncbi:hypothetical protein AB0M32_14685 [Streptomyces sp. NPDC051985]|uniref:hypothetical protein n=1 Tax=Streptomyces sp. NPDC051985 TaxID=3155807 RepID=UPI00341B158C